MDISSTFGILYILAQAVERIVEFISNLTIFGDPDSKEERVIHKRAILLWLVSSVLGVIVCLVFNVNFLTAFTNEHPTLSLICSGIIVGSGTKPVHDVISSIEKYARKS